MTAKRYAVCAFFVLLPAPSLAQQIDVDKVASCMVSHASPEDMSFMKKVMIAAMQDDVQAMKTGTMKFGASMLALAIKHCDLNLSQITGPEFAAVGRKYGETIVTKIITEAFAKIR